MGRHIRPRHTAATRTHVRARPTATDVRARHAATTHVRARHTAAPARARHAAATHTTTAAPSSLGTGRLRAEEEGQEHGKQQFDLLIRHGNPRSG
jgi:hypothetical protein